MRLREAAASYLVDGEILCVWEYAYGGQAETDARRIDPNGGRIGHTFSEWDRTPVFHQHERLIVAFVGRSERARTLLRRALGKPIAGSSLAREGTAAEQAAALDGGRGVR
jgi:hypothetical protein